MVSWLLAPHCKNGRGPSIDDLLGRQEPDVVELPDGVRATGDPELIGAIFGAASQTEKLEQLWARVQEQRKKAGAAE